jgi:hypothetical protein
MHFARRPISRIPTGAAAVPTPIPIVTTTGAIVPALFARLATGLTAGWLIGEPLRRIEFLLAGGENERVVAIATDQRFIRKTHGVLLLVRKNR